MKKKINRLQMRQRQKMSWRRIIVLSAACATCIAVCLTFLFHLSKVGTVAAREVVINEQEFTNEMILPAPVINQNSSPTTASITQQIRKIKEVQNNN